MKNKLRNKIWTFLKTKWKLRSGLEIIIENDSDWFVFNEIFANKEYDEALALLLETRPARPLILDLGANVGYFTLKVADELNQAGIQDFEIIAVEASPSNYDALKKRLKQGLLKGKAKAFFGLAGYRRGSHAVLHSQQHYGHSAVSEPTDSGRINVDFIDIEKILPNTSQKIDFLKCDIEGSEEIFINEYLTMLKRVENAVFEFHAGECDVERCRTLLKSTGLLSKGIIKEDISFRTTVEIFSRR